MTKILATCAAVALTTAFAMPVPASADTSKRTDGVRNVTEQTDVSARRRYRVARYHYGPRRYYAPRRYGYYRPYYARPYYYDAPYYAYAPRYRPYYGPSVGVGVGPLGFGLGFR